MLFYSAEFISLFLLISFSYFFLPYRFRWVLLLVASYLFYMYSNWLYMFLIFSSTFIDYWASIRIGKTDRRRVRLFFLLVSITFNLGLLFFFKYFNFFSQELAAVLGFFEIRWEAPAHHFLLPLGISFYTFQTMSYTIDVYRGHIKPEHHLGKFALYVSFFPQLIAGPIERAKGLLAQFHFQFDLDYDRIRSGSIRFLWGVFKKLVVADNLALYVSAVYGAPDEHQGLTVWIAFLLFGYQIYYDFSAYADMAIGLAKILGVRLSENFSHRIAFFAPSFVQLWREWHITLTSWVRDYVYVPLARLSPKRWYRRSVPLLTFFLIGLWHGASWNFIIWGTLMGVFYVIETWWVAFRNTYLKKCHALFKTRLWSILGSFTVMTLSILGLCFFRAPNLSDALQLLTNCTVPVAENLMVLDAWKTIVLLLALLTGEAVRKWMGKEELAVVLSRQPDWARLAFYFLLIEFIFFFAVPEGQEFIYFQF